MDGKVDALKLKILWAELCTKQNWQQLAASKRTIERKACLPNRKVSTKHCSSDTTTEYHSRENSLSAETT